MALSSPAPSSADSSFDLESAWAWVVENSRAVSYAAAAVVVAVVVFFFYREAGQKKNERAEQAFAGGQSAFYSGNLALAKSDLEKVITRYEGTPGGTQAAMLLAQILYSEGKHDDGINRLTAASKSAPKQFVTPVEELIAAGYSDTKRYTEAVEHLNRAAASAVFAADKAILQADAARLLAMAGKPDDARKIWESLAADPESPVGSEAKVRLGELSAKPAVR